MEENKTKQPRDREKLLKIFTIALVVATIIMTVISLFILGGYFSLYSLCLILLLLCAVVYLVLFLSMRDKKPMLVALDFILLAIYNIMLFVNLFGLEAYLYMDEIIYIGLDYIISVLLSILMIVLHVCSVRNKKCTKFYIIAAVIMAVLNLSLAMLLFMAAHITGIFCIKRAEPKPKTVSSETSSGDHVYTVSAGKQIALCLILSYCTCGIYLLYWVCSLIKTIKQINNEQPTCFWELVAIVCLPFYGAFWGYSRGKQIVAGAKNMGVKLADSSLLYLILNAFGLSMVTFALMQSEIDSAMAQSQQVQAESVSKQSDTEECDQQTTTA